MLRPRLILCGELRMSQETERTQPILCGDNDDALPRGQLRRATHVLTLVTGAHLAGTAVDIKDNWERRRAHLRWLQWRWGEDIEAKAARLIVAHAVPSKRANLGARWLWAARKHMWVATHGGSPGHGRRGRLPPRLAASKGDGQKLRHAVRGAGSLQPTEPRQLDTWAVFHDDNPFTG